MSSFREARIKKHLTQEQVANAVGISTLMYGLIENNKAKGSIDTYLNIKNFLEMSDTCFVQALNQKK